MNFFRSKIGVLAVLTAMVLVGSVVWYCLTKNTEAKEPEGTFVWSGLCMEVDS